MTRDTAAMDQAQTITTPAPLVSYHTHTDLSHCGKPDMTFEAAVEVAAGEGYATVGFSDHIHPPEVTNCPKHLARLRHYKDLRKGLSSSTQVLIGAEFDVLAPGTVSGSEELIAECEHFVVAPNHYHVHWVLAPEGGANEVACHELDTMETAIDWPHTDIIAHPFTGKVGRDGCGPNDQYRACDKGRLRELLARAVERGIALEIQPRTWHHLERAGDLAGLYGDWLDLGGLLAPGSDAHTLESLRHWRQAYGDIVQHFSLTPERMWRPPGFAAEDSESTGAGIAHRSERHRR